MECKVFWATSRMKLQDEVNEWLKTHQPESFNFQFSSVYLEDPVEHIIEHTLVLFYIPRVDE